MSEAIQTCKSCRYYVPNPGMKDEDYAECHRYPPQIVLETVPKGRWPTLPVHTYGGRYSENQRWCGEWTAR